MDSIRKWISQKHPLYLFFLVITGGYLLYVGAIFLNSLRKPRVESNQKKKPQISEFNLPSATARAKPTVERTPPHQQPVPSTSNASKDFRAPEVLFKYNQASNQAPVVAANHTVIESIPVEQSRDVTLPQAQPVPDVSVTTSEASGVEASAATGFHFKPVQAIVNDQDLTLTPGMFFVCI
jgi:hypothetical protein